MSKRNYDAVVAKLSYDLLPSGLCTFDRILGGGHPFGSIVELFGPEDVGKTAYAIHLLRMAASLGYKSVIIEPEMKLTDWRVAGIPGLAVYQPLRTKAVGKKKVEGGIGMCFERASLDIQNDPKVKVLVIDTIGALMSEEEQLEIQDQGKRLPGRQSLMVTTILNRNLARWRDHGVLVLAVNQTRSLIGRTGRSETTPGGRAMKYFAAQRIEIRRKELIKDKDGIHGHIAVFRTIKNEFASPFQSCELEFRYEGGRFSDVRQMLDLLMDRGDITKAGAYYTCGSEKFYGTEAMLADIVKCYAEYVELINHVEVAPPL